MALWFKFLSSFTVYECFVLNEFTSHTANSKKNHTNTEANHTQNKGIACSEYSKATCNGCL